MDIQVILQQQQFLKKNYERDTLDKYNKLYVQKIIITMKKNKQYFLKQFHKNNI